MEENSNLIKNKSDSKYTSLEISSDIERPILANENKYSSNSSNRLSSFDIYRGIIMIIMLIDHFDARMTTRQTSEFWYGTQPGYYMTFNGNLSIAMYKFAVRFTSAICAPGFFILMGFGLVHYYHHRLDKLKWSKLQIVKHLILRGILFIVLDKLLWCISRLPWYCDFSEQLPCTAIDFYSHADVLWALGTNLILLIPIVIIENHLYQQNYLYISYLILFLIILFSIISTQIMTPKYYQYDYIEISMIQMLLYTSLESSVFPTIPWTSFAVIGVILGRIIFITKKNYKHKMSNLYMIIFLFGIIILITFSIIRYFGSLDFGNFGYQWYDEQLIGPWIGIQFFELTRYPPSFSYFLFWTGCTFVLLSIIYYVCDYNNVPNKHGKLYCIILLYGNTALFFYMIHISISLYFSRLLSNRWYSLQFDKLSWWANLISIIVCLVMLISLYPICCWYKQFKANKKYTSYWKLF